MSQNDSEVTLRTQTLSKTSPKMTRKTISKMSNGRTTLKYRKERPKEATLCELHENAKRRVLNDMTEVCVMNPRSMSCAVEREI